LGTYDTPSANELSLEKLLKIFTHFQASRILVKKLSDKQDNSKNQIYLAGHLSDLSFMPMGDPVASITESQKKTVSAKPSKTKIKYQVPINWKWIDSEGGTYDAEHAKLIYYPQYPEVRLSGFLRGSRVDASEWMDRSKKGSSVGRWLLMAFHGDQIFAYLAIPGSQLANELEQSDLIPFSGVLSLIEHTISPLERSQDDLFGKPEILKQINDRTLDLNKTSSRHRLLRELERISSLGWIEGKKFDGRNTVPYRANNAGGYTLEAELGVAANGNNEPDYLGWEVKSFSVKELPFKGASKTTLMDPQPKGGFYGEAGLKDFLIKYGYPDKKGIPNRTNFGGTYRVGVPSKLTNMKLEFDGFDKSTGKIMKADGQLGLLDSTGALAAAWPFESLLLIWTRKHAKAVYVPRIKSTQKTLNGVESYMFGDSVELGVGTSFEHLLRAMQQGAIYYEPSPKMIIDDKTGKVKTQARHPFRINHSNLSALYSSYEKGVSVFKND